SSGSPTSPSPTTTTCSDTAAKTTYLLLDVHASCAGDAGRLADEGVDQLVVPSAFGLPAMLLIETTSAQLEPLPQLGIRTELHDRHKPTLHRDGSVETQLAHESFDAVEVIALAEDEEFEILDLLAGGGDCSNSNLEAVTLRDCAVVDKPERVSRLPRLGQRMKDLWVGSVHDHGELLARVSVLHKRREMRFVHCDRPVRKRDASSLHPRQKPN